MDYKTSGVDIEAGYKSVELMKEYVKETMRAEVLGGLGGFSGAFSLAKIKEMEEPVRYRRMWNKGKTCYGNGQT
jgi:phosphoribosylformylglycinamidine cyclo-ligase